jgi:hypothetical protein
MAQLTVSLINERLAATTGIDRLFSSTLYRLPTAVIWNRLEGRPRSDDLTRPLRAEVRDPAWMLARQWQFGEFEGEDAGTPIQAKMAVAVSPLKNIRIAERPALPYDVKTPVEFLVERQPIEPSLTMGLYVGRHWLRLLSDIFGAADPLLGAFRSRYPVVSPAPEAKDLRSLEINSNRAERVLRSALTRSLDGAAVLKALRRASESGIAPSQAFADDGVAIAVDLPTLDGLANNLLSWFDGLFSGPFSKDTPTAWIQRKLEYEFSLSAPEADGTESRLIADQFPGGHVDWHSFDLAAGQPTDGAELPPPADPPKSFVPSPVTFFGAPAARYWEFEDSRVGFGLTTASKTDLAKVLLAEFGLVFSNDWFMVPYRAQIGSLLDVKGIVVTDNFGFNTLVESVAKHHRELGFAGNWSMFMLARRNQPGQVDPRLFLAPALEPGLAAKPVDEVQFLRDEMANLVWGVETVIPDELGGGRDARLAAKELSQSILHAFPPPPPDADLVDVPVQYRLMGSVPENWIPFVAVKLSGQFVATHLLQGAMPRDPAIEPALGGDGQPVLENNIVLPRGTILARDPVNQPNVIHDEEVMRDGIVVRRRFRQARWTGGSTFTWSSLEKVNGRGEGSSGLAFDQAIQKPPKKQD